MRGVGEALAWAAVVGAVAAVTASACQDLADDPCLNDLASCSSSNDGGTDGGDSGPPPPCIPSANSTPVAGSCGVFVSSTTGDDTNGKGTQVAPYKTITKGLAKGTTIYACAGTMPYSEALTVDTPVTLFGALDCGTWAYVAANKTQLTASADAVPLTLSSSASGTAVNDFAITSADAMMAGASSIAVMDDGAGLALTRCDLTSGKGADGGPGMTPSGSGQAGANAPMPSPATALDGCVVNQNGVFGGQPGQSTCGATDTSGGSGGNGQNQASGGAGTDAQPQPQPNAMSNADGKAGLPQTTSAPCSEGDPGANGLPGTMPGMGATGLGDLTPTGYEGPTATAGQSSGSNGYGGGGGGGANKCLNGFAGPAGGGGGAGGCGGQPGGPGQSAGSSFALVSLGATISLNTVTLTSVDGGAGGVGGDGQPGGPGGTGGLAGSSGGDPASACNGGKGGPGGRGSSGGGGLGGHSAGIAFNGAAPTQMNVTINPGKGGSGGIGGDMDSTSPGIVGGDGLGCKTLDFTNPASPTTCGM